MEILFFNYAGDNKVINKPIDITHPDLRLTGTLRDSCDFLAPVIDIATNPTGMNYMYIAAFERYYFISSIESVRNGLWRIYGHVDVLKTYEPWIRNCDIIVTKCSYNPGYSGNSKIGYNAFLADSNIPIIQTTRHRAIQFGHQPYHPELQTSYDFDWYGLDNNTNLYLVTVG